MNSIHDKKYALVVQALGASIALALNIYAFSFFHAKDYVIYSIFITIMTSANYYDLGFIGKIRFMSATGYEEDLIANQYAEKGKCILYYQICILFSILVSVEYFANVTQYLIVLFFAPAMVLLNAKKAFLEGSEKIIHASFIKSLIGIVLCGGPVLIANYASLGMQWAILWTGLLALIISIIYNVDIFLKIKINRVYETEKKLDVVEKSEVIFTVVNYISLYFDRLVIYFIGAQELMSVYIFSIDILSRYSMIYNILIIGNIKKIYRSFAGYKYVERELVKIYIISYVIIIPVSLIFLMESGKIKRDDILLYFLSLSFIIGFVFFNGFILALQKSISQSKRRLRKYTRAYVFTLVAMIVIIALFFKLEAVNYLYVYLPMVLFVKVILDFVGLKSLLR